MSFKQLTHCGLVTPNGEIDLCQHWLRQLSFYENLPGVNELINGLADIYN